MPNTAAARRARRTGDELVRTFQSLPLRARHEGLPTSGAKPTGYVRDLQRTRVYDAEAAFHHLVRTRADYPRARVAGVLVDVPDPLRFGDLDAVQTFTDQVTEWAGASRVSVRTDARLTRRAHYSGGVVTLPLGGDPRWAWAQPVVLHELAHHLTAGARHEAPFPGTLIVLFETWISPQAGLLLRLLYTEEGVKL